MRKLALNLTTTPLHVLGSRFVRHYSECTHPSFVIRAVDRRFPFSTFHLYGMNQRYMFLPFMNQDSYVRVPHPPFIRSEWSARVLDLRLMQNEWYFFLSKLIATHASFFLRVALLGVNTLPVRDSCGMTSHVQLYHA